MCSKGCRTSSRPRPVILAGRSPCAIWQGSLSPKSINSLNNQSGGRSPRSCGAVAAACRDRSAVLCVPVMFLSSIKPSATVGQVFRASAGFAFLLIASAGGLSVAGRLSRKRARSQRASDPASGRPSSCAWPANSMVNAGLFDGDILIVDRAEQGLWRADDRYRLSWRGEAQIVA